MKIIYRISDVGFRKEKPEYINNEACLQNALKVFSPDKHDWIILYDSPSEESKQWFYSQISTYKTLKYEFINIKDGPGFPFMYILDKLLKESKDENEIIYFLENDYIHLLNSSQIIEEVFKLGADYTTLYLHPDKFISPQNGGNPEVDSDGGYLTKIFRGETELYAMFNSTTGTFASKIKTLREDYEIIKKWANQKYWNDFQMFLELREKGRSLLCPLNSYSTHAEKLWLAPLSKIKQENLEEEWKKYL